jgi:hypothetical protein
MNHLASARPPHKKELKPKNPDATNATVCTFPSSPLNAIDTAITSQQSSTATITSIITSAGVLRLSVVCWTVILTDAMSEPEVFAVLVVDGLIYCKIEGPAVLFAKDFEVQHG